jgi:hypothetical protein
MLPILTTATRCLILFLWLTALAARARAEILHYTCTVGEVTISLHIDTDIQSIEQISRAGSVVEIGQYTDGAFGSISHTGAAGALIPPVHQFVLISGETIQYGAELHGIKDMATLNRRLRVLTIPSGQSGWCDTR